jgi:hypothetical protein
MGGVLDGEEGKSERRSRSLRDDSQEGKGNGDCRSLHFASQRQERDAAVEMTELKRER